MKSLTNELASYPNPQEHNELKNQLEVFRVSSCSNPLIAKENAGIYK